MDIECQQRATCVLTRLMSSGKVKRHTSTEFQFWTVARWYHFFVRIPEHQLCKHTPNTPFKGAIKHLSTRASARARAVALQVARNRGPGPNKRKQARWANRLKSGEQCRKHRHPFLPWADQFRRRTHSLIPFPFFYLPPVSLFVRNYFIGFVAFVFIFGKSKWRTLSF